MVLIQYDMILNDTIYNTIHDTSHSNMIQYGPNRHCDIFNLIQYYMMLHKTKKCPVILCIMLRGFGDSFKYDAATFLSSSYPV